MNLKTLLASLFMLSPAYISPVIPEVEVWSNGTNYRYLLGDWHRDYLDGRTSIKQHKDILWAVEQPKSKDVFILAEDRDNYPGKNKKIQGIYKSTPLTIEQAVEKSQMCCGIDPKKAPGSTEIFLSVPVSPLFCLIAACQTQEVPHYNTECGHAIDLYPCKSTQQEVVDDLTEHVSGLKQHSLLKKNYELFTRELEELRTMKLPDMKPALSKEYLRHIVLRKLLGLPLPTPAEKEFIKKAEEIRSTLVNDKTVQKLIEWDTIKHGFVCEGEFHTESIKPYLKALGYQHIQSFGRTITWPSLEDSKEQWVGKAKQAIAHAVDLQATFRQVFAQTAS